MANSRSYQGDVINGRLVERLPKYASVVRTRRSSELHHVQKAFHVGLPFEFAFDRFLDRSTVLVLVDVEDGRQLREGVASEDFDEGVVVQAGRALASFVEPFGDALGDRGRVAGFFVAFAVEQLLEELGRDRLIALHDFDVFLDRAFEHTLVGLLELLRFVVVQGEKDFEQLARDVPVDLVQLLHRQQIVEVARVQLDGLDQHGQRARAHGRLGPFEDHVHELVLVLELEIVHENVSLLARVRREELKDEVQVQRVRGDAVLHNLAQVFRVAFVVEFSALTEQGHGGLTLAKRIDTRSDDERGRAVRWSTLAGLDRVR